MPVSGSHTIYLKDFYGYILVFMRFGGLLAYMPGIGDHTVSPRLRMLLALGLCVILTPVVQPYLPAMPQAVSDNSLLLIFEFILGIFAALMARVLLAALDVAGATIASNMGIVNSFVQSIASAQQGGIASVFFTLLGTLMIFETEMHYRMISMMIDTYEIYKPGDMTVISTIIPDLSQTVLKFVQAAFVLALQLSAPIIILNLLMLFGMGMINRLMPSIQIFFILQPLQSLLGFVLLILGLGIMMNHFTAQFADMYQSLWNRG